MKAPRLTDAQVRNFKPAPPGKRVFEPDPEVPGCGFRLTDKSTDAYVTMKRIAGAAQVSPRLVGKYGVMTLAELRAKGRAMLAEIAAGKDPTKEEERRLEAEAEAQRKEEAAKARADASTFAAALDLYEPYISKLRSKDEVLRAMRRDLLPIWGPMPLASITRKEIKRVIKEIHDGGAPIAANRLLAYIKTFFAWAVDVEELIEDSPAVLVKKLASENQRDRFLDRDEIRACWRAAGKLGYPFGTLYRVLMLSGLRLAEAADARWREFDLAERTWTIPAARMKGDLAHMVPISDELLAILQELPRFKGDNDYLFTTTNGRAPISGFSKPKLRLDEKMLAIWRAIGRLKGDDRRKKTPEPWVIHDFRRTVRTNLSRLKNADGQKIAEEVREAVLAHVRPGIKKVYDRHDYLDEKREALTLWAAELRSIVDPPPTPKATKPQTSNVVKLAGRRDRK
jgi:integrase